MDECHCLRLDLGGMIPWLLSSQYLGYSQPTRFQAGWLLMSDVARLFFFAAKTAACYFQRTGNKNIPYPKAKTAKNQVQTSIKNHCFCCLPKKYIHLLLQNDETWQTKLRGFFGMELAFLEYLQFHHGFFSMVHQIKLSMKDFCGARRFAD